MHENTLLLFERYARPYFEPGVRVLEVGPDRASRLQGAMIDVPMEWETVDIADRPHVTYVASSEYSFPIPDNRYDVVIAVNVLEHVRKIWLWIQELARVCRTGGVVITISPVSWPYHAYPIDCWRAYPEGMKALYEDARLRVVLSECGALADSHLRRSVPGRSQDAVAEQSGWRMRAITRFLVGLGYPVERAFDTITIGRKESCPGECARARRSARMDRSSS